MPFKSDKQRRMIYAKAGQGVAWARKFIEDSGHHPPPAHKKGKHSAKDKHAAIRSMVGSKR